METVHISLPELPKDSRTPGKSPHSTFYKPKLYIQNLDRVIIFPVYPFKGPNQGRGSFVTVYAQTLIVVVLIVVKFIGFLVITRNQ